MLENQRNRGGNVCCKTNKRENVLCYKTKEEYEEKMFYYNIKEEMKNVPCCKQEGRRVGVLIQYQRRSKRKVALLQNQRQREEENAITKSKKK